MYLRDCDDDCNHYNDYDDHNDQWSMLTPCLKNWPRGSLASSSQSLLADLRWSWNIMMITVLLVEYCIFEIVMILMIRKPAGEGQVCPRARSHCGRKLWQGRYCNQILWSRQVMWSDTVIKAGTVIIIAHVYHPMVWRSWSSLLSSFLTSKSLQISSRTLQMQGQQHQFHHLNDVNIYRPWCIKIMIIMIMMMIVTIGQWFQYLQTWVGGTSKVWDRKAAPWMVPQTVRLWWWWWRWWWWWWWWWWWYYSSWRHLSILATQCRAH